MKRHYFRIICNITETLSNFKQIFIPRKTGVAETLPQNNYRILFKNWFSSRNEFATFPNLNVLNSCLRIRTLQKRCHALISAVYRFLLLSIVIIIMMTITIIIKLIYLVSVIFIKIFTVVFF